MRPMGLLVGSTLCLAARSQVTEYTYSRKNFTAPTFESDLAACRHANSVSSYQSPPPKQSAQLDDAAVRDCMQAKGYKIEPEGR